MLRGRDVDEIKELKREGLSIRAISRLTGYDRKTISRYLLAPGGRPVYGPRPVQMGKLEPFKQYLKERLKAGVWNAQVLFHVTDNVAIDFYRSAFDHRQKNAKA